MVRDPELRHTTTDKPVASFTLAVDRGYKHDNDAVNADFINCVAWRGTAEFIAKWFTKGQLVAVSGRLSTRTYKDKDSNTRTATEVVVDEAFFAESKRNSAEGTRDMGKTEFAEIEPVQGEFSEVIGNDEELPF
jgi:single-strand DNA-binding protein